MEEVNNTEQSQTDKKLIITLIGESLAKKNFKFFFMGKSEKNEACDKCPTNNVCLSNLERNRVYQIVELREIKHPCKIHMGEVVKVVECVLADVEIVIESKQCFLGATLIYQKPECDESDCPYKELCFPEYLKEGDRIKILEIFENEKLKECKTRGNIKKVLVSLNN